MTSSPFVVAVKFQTTPDNQRQALEEIRHYLNDFLSQQNGFISAKLHRSLDGNNILNYAHWKSAEDFKAFANKARTHPDLAKLIEYKPEPLFLEIDSEF